MSPSFDSLLAQQNDRLKFYNQDFWAVVNFFSALILLLISSPFAVWTKEIRPNSWTLITSVGPLLAFIMSCVALDVLKRTAESYYEVGASVVVLERLLELHHFERPSGEPTVHSRRILQAEKSVDELALEYMKRLQGPFGSSRMAVVLTLFWAYVVISFVEFLVLVLHGAFNFNPLRFMGLV